MDYEHFHQKLAKLNNWPNLSFSLVQSGLGNRRDSQTKPLSERTLSFSMGVRHVTFIDESEYIFRLIVFAIINNNYFHETEMPNKSHIEFDCWCLHFPFS